MINLILFLIVLACVGIITSWVAENPGQVTMYWFDYRIDTSVAGLLILTGLTAIAITLAWLMLRRLLGAPSRLIHHRQLKHYKQAISELTYSVAALAAADPKGAELHTKKAEKLIGRSPLTVMLSAQIARSQGKDDATRELLEQLLDYKETEYLAARSLSDAANQQKLFPTALELAERAYAIGPKDAQSASAVVSLHVRLGQWQEALLAIRKAHYASRAEKRRHLGLVHLQQGLTLLQTQHHEEALTQAKACFALLADFPPAAIFTAQAFAANGQSKKAVQIIKQGWNHTPHPQLITALRQITQQEPYEKQRQLIAAITHNQPTPAGMHWHCNQCGNHQEEWTIHCLECGGFDSLIWK
ncbi:MAG: heme biosynthesis HemY N-terminal domain-containing protein [Rickettsiales bacterium]|nr:heme biosynthesis HemY N-terminal domain-containing protein [Rickettsiales bacterium]